jgi:dTDP-4-dehydrorhamnose reductase
MRVTVFGASGLLGHALMREWTNDEVTGLTSKDADIRDAQQVLKVVERSRPEWIVLAAAYTDVDGCETYRDLAFDVNLHGAANVARAARAVGARLLFLSSDYVFDGTKTTPYETNDPRAPKSVYGASKAQAEVRLLDNVPDCCIVRTSWLFGVGGKCFPDTILRIAASRSEIDVVNDQRGGPTYNVDLAHAIFQLCRNGANGIVHVTNEGDCTWFEFAEAIVGSAGLKTLVRPTTTENLARPAPRPKYSVLSPRSLHQYDLTLPPWQEALQRYLAQRGSEPIATVAGVLPRRTKEGNS